MHYARKSHILGKPLVKQWNFLLLWYLNEADSSKSMLQIWTINSKKHLGNPLAIFEVIPYYNT